MKVNKKTIEHCDECPICHRKGLEDGYICMLGVISHKYMATKYKFREVTEYVLNETKPEWCKLT